MIDLYIEALSADYETVCEIMSHIGQCQKFYEAKAEEYFQVREYYLRIIEAEILHSVELSTGERGNLYDKIKEYSAQYRIYKINAEICTALKHCGFFFADNESDKMYFFREAVTNVINREDK